MTLTIEQNKRLAKEARRLAMEIVRGRGPRLNPHSYCGCAAAEIAKRALGVRPSFSDGTWEISQEIDRLLPDDPALAQSSGNKNEGLVSAALRYDPSGAALPFPLLALADALDEAAK